jgi:hypothetical protein
VHARASAIPHLAGARDELQLCVELAHAVAGEQKQQIQSQDGPLALAIGQKLRKISVIRLDLHTRMD